MPSMRPPGLVELGGAERRDGRRGIGGCEVVRVKVDGEEYDSGGIAGHGKRAGEWACGRTCGTWSGRGEEALEERARGVHEQGREDEIALTEYGLVVLGRFRARGISYAIHGSKDKEYALHTAKNAASSSAIN